MTLRSMMICVLCFTAWGCGWSTPAGGADAAGDRPRDGVASSGGSAGGTGGAGGAGGGGSGGIAGSGGSRPDAAGSGDAGAGGMGGGPQGTQPIGAVCANSGNCSQTSGAAVCCVNTCLPSDECPNNQFVACDPPPTYACRTGRCCRAMTGGQTILYCTKSNGCAGTFVP